MITAARVVWSPVGLRATITTTRVGDSLIRPEWSFTQTEVGEVITTEEEATTIPDTRNTDPTIAAKEMEATIIMTSTSVPSHHWTPPGVPFLFLDSDLHVVEVQIRRCRYGDPLSVLTQITGAQ